MSKKVLSKINNELTNFHKIVNLVVLPIESMFIDINDVKSKIEEFNINEKGYLSLVIKYLTRRENNNWLNILVNENLQN